ncbi:molybdate ABC transporter permease subunit [Flavobacteriales bacterium]|nr:molybdate ABC transporter permease subunit [Flavobacteriales bacterium]
MDWFNIEFFEWKALLLSLKVAIITVCINLPISLFLAFYTSREKHKLNRLILSLVNLPLLIPPLALGFILLLTLGKESTLGGFLFDNLGIRLSFSFIAALIASMIVSFPLIFNPIKQAFDTIHEQKHKTIKSLRLSSKKSFWKIYFPLAKGGIIIGSVMAFARSFGEFGATLVFAGNIPGISQTMPLAMYNSLQIPGQENSAIRLLVISLVISFIAIFLAHQKNNNRLI